MRAYLIGMSSFFRMLDLIVQPVHGFFHAIKGIPVPAFLFNKGIGHTGIYTSLGNTIPIGIALPCGNKLVALAVLEVYHTNSVGILLDVSRHIFTITVQVEQVQAQLQFQHML